MKRRAVLIAWYELNSLKIVDRAFRRLTGEITLLTKNICPPCPGFENLYSLSDPVSKRPLRLRKNIDCFAVTRGEIAAPESVFVWRFMGGAMPSDRAWASNIGLMIVHRHVYL